MLKSKTWLICWLLLTCAVLCVAGGLVYKVDPYMHYHKPDINTYFYDLNYSKNNERRTNDGITKHFDYDAIITGSSMVQNFKTSEMDRLFGVTSIKVGYPGGTYKEVNDNLIIALNRNPQLKIIVRSLDIGRLINDKDALGINLSDYPGYLYDDNPLNDVKYLFNRSILWTRAYQMARESNEAGFAGGITSSDDYSRWQDGFSFGINSLCPQGIDEVVPGKAVHLTDEERAVIKGNIEQNVVSLADEYQDVEFYYFFTPYSILFWKDELVSGDIYRQIEAEQYAIELILECDNIRLFSFSNRADIITDLNNYKDVLHYGEWINSLMLKSMHDSDCQLTWDNYLDHIHDERSFFLNYDYNKLNGQADYEADYYAGALLNEELTGAKPIEITQGEVASASVEIQQADGHRYLSFFGKRLAGQGQPVVAIFDQQNELLYESNIYASELDDRWHQYVLNVPELSGKITICFNGGCIDDSGAEDSAYSFRDIVLY